LIHIAHAQRSITGNAAAAGIDANQMLVKQTEKIEELTLYVIDQNKKIENMESQNAQLKQMQNEIETLKQLLNKKDSK
jgi:small-conductance mechanosensitive channel